MDCALGLDIIVSSAVLFSLLPSQLFHCDAEILSLFLQNLALSVGAYRPACLHIMCHKNLQVFFYS